MGGRDGGGKREGVHMSVQADVWVEVAERKMGCLVWRSSQDDDARRC